MLGADRLIKLIRNISLARMTQQGQVEGLQIQEVDGNPSVYSHWMAIILVSGSSIKLTFKTHFKTRFAQIMAANAYNLSPEKIGRDQAIDFMREFCNLTAGGTKASLLSNSINLAISLPIVTRGFDEIFFTELLTQKSLTDHWRLAAKNCEIFCSTTIDFFETVDLTNIEPDFVNGPRSESEIELF